MTAYSFTTVGRLDPDPQDGVSWALHALVVPLGVSWILVLVHGSLCGGPPFQEEERFRSGSTLLRDLPVHGATQGSRLSNGLLDGAHKDLSACGIYQSIEQHKDRVFPMTCSMELTEACQL